MILKENSPIFNRAKEGDADALYGLAAASLADGNVEGHQNFLSQAAQKGHAVAAQELEAETGIVIEPLVAE